MALKSKEEQINCLKTTHKKSLEVVEKENALLKGWLSKARSLVDQLPDPKKTPLKSDSLGGQVPDSSPRCATPYFGLNSFMGGSPSSSKGSGSRLKSNLLLSPVEDQFRALVFGDTDVQ